MNWPDWWHWELELTPHVERRMEDRGFNEVDLRRMLEEARAYRPDTDPLRFAVDCRHAGRRWTVIVEPDAAERLLVVVTACPVYPVEP